MPNLKCIVFFFFKDLFIHKRHREREREAETQAEGEAGSTPEPDMGLDPGTPGSHPGPKAGVKPLSHPGIPLSLVSIPEMPHMPMKTFLISEITAQV